MSKYTYKRLYLVGTVVNIQGSGTAAWDLPRRQSFRKAGFELPYCLSCCRYCLVLVVTSFRYSEVVRPFEFRFDSDVSLSAIFPSPGGISFTIVVEYLPFMIHATPQAQAHIIAAQLPSHDQPILVPHSFR